MSLRLLAAPLACALCLGVPAGAVDLWGGRLELHGVVETDVRAINQDLQNEWDLSMWKFRLELELEASLLEKPHGILDLLTAYVRLDTSYDCVWTRGCTLFPGADAYGNQIGRSGAQYRSGRRNGFVGDDPAVNPVNPASAYHPTKAPVGLADTPPFEILADNESFATAFAPLLGHRFLVRQNAVTASHGDSSGLDATVQIPRPKDEIANLGSLSGVPNATFPELSYRPLAQGLFQPSAALREVLARAAIGRFDQNFSQTELAWNIGASQDLGPLREAYLDAELFDTRLFLRLGRQTIVWGKTELFRNQDLLNPEDVALTTLASLEESRIPVWGLRGIWSFYDLGPLRDVRAEVAWIFDDFEPTDVGRCGEPYSPLPVCNKAFSLFQHGALGVGLAGEKRPPRPLESLSGQEIGGRIEFRWKSISFAVSDFWHFDDRAHPLLLGSYERRVDPDSGHPLSSQAPWGASCVTGAEPGCLKPGSVGPDNALVFTPLNRQLFDVVCASSVGFFALDPDACALTLTNSRAPLAVPPPLPPGLLLAELVSATAAGNTTAGALVEGLAMQPLSLVALNTDPCDSSFEDDCGPPLAPGQGYFAGLPAPFRFPTLQEVLTDPQEALLGCGPFYQSSCDVDGLDLFHTEASVLLQSWPGVVPGSPVATRYARGGLDVLPGARGPGHPLYDPLVDGCVGPLPPGLDPAGWCAMSDDLTDPRSPTGERFASEMAALSYDALLFVVALDLADADTPAGCGFPTAADPEAPLLCPTVQDFFSVTATTLPEVRAGGNERFGRRDFVWAGAAELLLDYARINTLGFAMDFTEDRTRTAWGLELTWTHDRAFADSSARDLVSESDVVAFSVSVDRPTFIRFLNADRTFFFNMQWFLEYITDYRGGGGRRDHRGFLVEGPFTALGTISVQTGYFQDRLLPVVTAVYDVRTGSGGALWQLTYRYTANLSISIGFNYFFGKGHGQRIPIAFGAVGESNQTHQVERFPRLTAVRERDEVYASLRFAF